MSSGAGALHSKCPRGRRGSLGAGGTRELALPAPYTADEPRAASRRNGAPEQAPAVTASHNPEAEPRATPMYWPGPALGLLWLLWLL